MSLNDKSKKELADIAKQLKIKTNSKMDKKALISLIEEHNKQHNHKPSIEEEIKKKEVLETILHPKEERITQQDLKDIQEARAEMTDQASDEAVEEVFLNHDNSVKETVKNTSSENDKLHNETKTAPVKKSSNDEFLYSEGYTGKSSYQMS